MTWLAAVFAVSARASLSASVIGLSVTYAMQVKALSYIIEKCTHCICIKLFLFLKRLDKRKISYMSICLLLHESPFTSILYVCKYEMH